MKRWNRVKTTKTVKFGKFYSVDVDTVVTPGGVEVEYSVIRMKPFSIIIPIDKYDKIFFVRQHRYPVNDFTLELPKGNTDGEDPLMAAKRELEEEAGLVSDNWTCLGKIQEANGISDINGHIFLAKGVISVENPKKDPLDENLFEISKFSLSGVRYMIASGIIEDSATICAIAKLCFSENIF